MPSEDNQFQCKLCGCYKSLANQNPHPKFYGLCCTCVKPMRSKVRGHNRRMRKFHSIGVSHQISTLSPTDWVTVLRQHNFCCAGCGVHSAKSILTLDHIYPLALGGMNRPHNIQPLCEECHAKKDLAPTTLPWEVKKVSRKAVRTARRKKARNKDFCFFKKLGVMPSEEWFIETKLKYDENEEFNFYKTFHNYIIEQLLMLWLDKSVEERERRND